VIRYVLAILVAIVGGLAGPIPADALELDGQAAYGLFLAGIAVCVPIAIALFPGVRGGLARPQHH